MFPIFLTDARPSTEGDFYVDGSVTDDGAALIDSNLSIVKHKIQKSPMLVNNKLNVQHSSHLTGSRLSWLHKSGQEGADDWPWNKQQVSGMICLALSLHIFYSIQDTYFQMRRCMEFYFRYLSLCIKLKLKVYIYGCSTFENSMPVHVLWIAVSSLF